MTTKVCEKCGKIYRPLKGNQKYCVVCKAKPDTKQELHTITCPVCGKLHNSLLYNKKYCSKVCRDLSKRDMTRLKTKICAHCGENFETTRISKKYCSLECALDHKKEYDANWKRSHNQC